MAGGTKKIYEVYDSERVRKMGEELGYMGFFQSRKAAEEYIEECGYLFEGEAYIKEYEECV